MITSLILNMIVMFNLKNINMIKFCNELDYLFKYVCCYIKNLEGPRVGSPSFVWLIIYHI